MKMTKKWLCLVLALLLVASCAACAAEPDDANTQSTEPSAGGNTETTQATDESTSPTQTDPTEDYSATDPTESTGETDPTESTGTTDPTDPTQGTDATQPTGSGNSGGTDTTQPTNPPANEKGSKNNPADLVIGNNEAKPTASSGYYYTYTATKDATLKLEFSGSWAYEINNLTAGDAMKQKSSSWDERPASVAQIGVLKGDKLEIIVKKADGKAGTVNFKASLSDTLLGAKTNPVLVQVGTTTGIRVPAGKTVYFHGHVAGTWMSIGNAADAKLKFNNKTYSPKSGKIELSIPAGKPGDSGDREFTITNNSDSVQIYTVNCYIPTGTYENPETLTLGTHTTTGSSNGYVYQWKATKAGTFTLQITSSNWLYVIDKIDKNYVPVQYTQDSAGKGDSNSTNPMSIEVKAGDTIKILINTNDGSDAKVTFKVSFE